MSIKNYLKYIIKIKSTQYITIRYLFSVNIIGS